MLPFDVWTFQIRSEVGANSQSVSQQGPMRSMNIRGEKMNLWFLYFKFWGKVPLNLKSHEGRNYFFLNDSFDSILLAINRLAWHIAVEFASENFEFVNMKRTLYTFVLCNIITNEKLLLRLQTWSIIGQNHEEDNSSAWLVHSERSGHDPCGEIWIFTY